jgi:hypothetical protein
MACANPIRSGRMVDIDTQHHPSASTPTDHKPQMGVKSYTMKKPHCAPKIRVASSDSGGATNTDNTITHTVDTTVSDDGSDSVHERINESWTIGSDVSAAQAKAFFERAVEAAKLANDGNTCYERIKAGLPGCLPFPYLPLKHSGKQHMSSQTFMFSKPYSHLVTSAGKHVTRTMVDKDLHITIKLDNKSLMAGKEVNTLTVPTSVCLESFSARGLPCNCYLSFVSEVGANLEPRVWGNGVNCQSNSKNTELGLLIPADSYTLTPTNLYEWDESHVLSDLFQNWSNVDFDTAMTQAHQATVKQNSMFEYAQFPVNTQADFLLTPAAYIAVVFCDELWAETRKSAAFDPKRIQPLKDESAGTVLRVPAKALFAKIKQLQTETALHLHAMRVSDTMIRLVIPEFEEFETYRIKTVDNMLPGFQDPMLSLSFVVSIDGTTIDPYDVTNTDDIVVVEKSNDGESSGSDDD